MKSLRTPDSRFENLPGYEFEHSWSYLYRHMIPPLRDAGFRVIAPDLIGFGISDKPAQKSDYTYAGHFLREDKGADLAEVLIAFCDNP